MLRHAWYAGCRDEDDLDVLSHYTHTVMLSHYTHTVILLLDRVSCPWLANSEGQNFSEALHEA